MEAIRDAPFGQLVRYLTNNKYFQYPEEQPDFKLPEQWVLLMNNGDLATKPSRDGSSDDEKTVLEDSQPPPSLAPSAERISRTSSQDTLSFTESQLEADIQHEIEKVRSIPVATRKTKDGSILVDWYYTDDAENPHNWSNTKRALVTTLICLYTFVVYTTSAIYTSSAEGIMKQFGVNDLLATLGLSLYVLGYGAGPLVFSPLSEIPVIGRNPVYIITMFLFVIISIPTSLVGNFAGLMVLRFLQGFFGSPCLASGGASIGDLYSLISLPYAMMAWVSAAYCGPALGPLLSGFAVPAETWRWSLFESIWASAPVFLLMLFFLPETSSATILLRRAERLRRIYNNDRFMAQSEIDQRNMKVSHVAIDALIKPLEITIKDPAVLFVQVYTAIIYGIYYSFFEAFPLVYPVDYHMNLGQVGLVFLCILVACIIGIAVYVAYIYYWLNPRIARFGFGAQEERLLPALPASFGPTIGLFLFAWTARASIHWIVPTIGITIYGATVFIVMQCIFVYIPLSYPQYAASLFAANDFFRSALACGSVLFAHPLFGNLGIARGVSLLGGLSVIGIIGVWLLYFYGARLRALSKFAQSSSSE
ncbi:major facilitator superfamily domain-containing protein [Penicillium hispanicum]|uniref:major facilitator superfamily domain-containing protein n=1 Tax=Penicillium hispanicum TaxID=1080232 RepID=UPI002540838C|nr:major facilitator superfamily domain-containing protein [Penicillium hispanicum]KAJ5594760.1 major facilitator superfamily domain-containing protein [Penicillium hispanicum]